MLAPGVFRCEKCPPGYFNEDEEAFSCTICPKGFYCSASSLQHCGDVITGSSSLPGSVHASSCECPLGTYMSDSQCQTCSTEGMECSTPGLTLETVKITPGYWRTSAASEIVKQCPFPELCTGQQTCPEGHTGPYCLLCEQSYAMSAGSSEF